MKTHQSHIDNGHSMASTCCLIIYICLLQISYHWPILFVNFEELFDLQVLVQVILVI